jgi:FMN phosphatase YigB (HAD superfamily)
MIRAVFFDLDGTLYDRDAAILRMADEQFEAFREELGVDISRILAYSSAPLTAPAFLLPSRYLLAIIPKLISAAQRAGLIPVWKRMPYWEVPNETDYHTPRTRRFVRAR